MLAIPLAVLPDAGYLHVANTWHQSTDDGYVQAATVSISADVTVDTRSRDHAANSPLATTTAGPPH
jgi:hypothetical protein